MVILALLAEEPLHPYRMQQRIKERGKDRVANVARPNSVYQTIDGLKRAGLVAVRETSRDERRPERTLYEITETGKRTLQHWLLAMLASPERGFPDFPAALAFLPLLVPEAVRRQLEARAKSLRKRLSETDTVEIDLPRLFLIEEEYRKAIVQADLNWTLSLVEDLKTGRLTWNEAWLRQFAEMAGNHAGD
jgi:DNA-binding PadR family transcriptional regulator